MLYDLQKVCVDHERGVYSLDLWRWIKSFGRAPLKRPLPGQRDVLISKHLHSAARRLSSVRISGRARALPGIAAAIVPCTEPKANLRTKFRATINATLDEVQLVPRNLPERIAREKLVEELLDRIVERGFLVMGGFARRAVAQQPQTPRL